MHHRNGNDLFEWYKTALQLTRSDTDVAMSSMIMSSSVVPGIRMEAKYSVMFGEQHLAKTDTSCIAPCNLVLWHDEVGLGQ